MSRRLGYMILHTGAPYLRYAIQSILPQVDKLMIFYSPKPSQGHQTDMPCPDREGDLLVEVLDLQEFQDNGDPKIQWVAGNWSNETDHVNAVQSFTEGFDWLVRLDADEIFPDGMVDEMIRQADLEQNKEAKDYRVPFVHFWRSFSKCCRDGSHPIRLSRVNGGTGIKTLDSKSQQWEVLHFGYCIPDKYILYKTQVSGHRSEWRKDWYEERWKVNAQRDVHPVMFPHHWHTQDYDKSKMPTLMRSHPYFSVEVIE